MKAFLDTDKTEIIKHMKKLNSALLRRFRAFRVQVHNNSHQTLLHQPIQQNFHAHSRRFLPVGLRG